MSIPIRLITAAVLYLCFVTPASEAANLKVTPTLVVRETYDTNILYESKGKELEDFIFRAEPGLSISLETLNNSITINGGIEVERYSSHKELDSTADTKNINLKTGSPFQLTPRLSIQPSIRYFQTEDTNRRSQFLADNTVSIIPQGVVVNERTRAENYGGALGVKYQISMNSSLEMEAGGDRTKVEGNDPTLIGSKVITGNATFLYRVSPETSTGVFTEVSNDKFDDGTTNKRYSGGITGTYKKGTTEMTARVGVASIVEETPGGKTDDSSPEGKLGVQYVGDRITAILNAGYVLSASGRVFGTSTKRGYGSIVVAYRMREFWTFDLSGTYTNERSIGERVSLNADTTEITTGFRYVATQWVTLNLAGTITRQRSRGGVSGSLDKESIFFGVELKKNYQVF